jgi:hypothetical protein
MYYVAFPGHISFFRNTEDAWNLSHSLPYEDNLLIDLLDTIQVGRIHL